MTKLTDYEILSIIKEGKKYPLSSETYRYCEGGKDGLIMHSRNVHELAALAPQHFHTIHQHKHIL